MYYIPCCVFSLFSVGEAERLRCAALGSERVAEEISKMLGRCVTPGKAGRPRKKYAVGKGTDRE